MKVKRAKKNLNLAFTQKAMEDQIKRVDKLAQQQRHNFKNLDRIYRKETRSLTRKYQQGLVFSKQQLEKLKERTGNIREAKSKYSNKCINGNAKVHKDFSKSHKFIDKCYKRQAIAIRKSLQMDWKILRRKVKIDFRCEGKLCDVGFK